MSPPSGQTSLPAPAPAQALVLAAPYTQNLKLHDALLDYDGFVLYPLCPRHSKWAPCLCCPAAETNLLFLYTWLPTWYTEVLNKCVLNKQDLQLGPLGLLLLQ